jgi:mono/diheme cytochrome c family protein
MAVLKIFTDANCGLCHGMATIGGGLMFKPTDAMGTYTALVGSMAAGTSMGMCLGKTYVVAGNPDASLLYQKLQPTPPCGARMPATGTFLTDDQIKTVHDWIMAGAKND